MRTPITRFAAVLCLAAAFRFAFGGTATAQPNPSLSMQLRFAGHDSVVIAVKMTNNNYSWGCLGIMAAVAYTAGDLTPFALNPVYNVYFSRHSWTDFSNPYLEIDGFDPDIMGYGETVFSNSPVTIAPNAVLELCRMKWWAPPVNSGTVHFAFTGNIPVSGTTGYLWNNDPDQRAFGSVSGLQNITWPVELAGFRGEYDGSQVLLRWTTEAETNNHGFEVERRLRSADGGMTAWSRIDFIRGRGTTAERTEYLTIDRSVEQPGAYQYRLRQIDEDGTHHYSFTIEVTVPARGNAPALAQNFPNPVGARSGNGTRTTIAFTIPPAVEGVRPFVELRLYDQLGREVRTLYAGEVGAGTMRIEVDAAGLTAGTYLYRLTVGGQSMTRKIHVLN